MQKLSLQQKLLQKLSPQQIQVIKLLEIPTTHLEQRIKKELEENPVLDIEKDQTENEENDFQNELKSSEDGENEEFSVEDYLNDEDIPSYKYTTKNYSSDDKYSDIPFSVGKSFHDYLIEQLGLAIFSDDELLLAEQIIGNIDEDGYLRRDLESITDDLAFLHNTMTSESELLSILRVIQEFDPPGIAARNLRECLRLQIERKDISNPTVKLASLILRDSFESFSRKHYDKITRKFGINEDELKSALNEILKLNPKPGSSFSNTLNRTAQTITPDFILELADGSLQLSLNQKNVPELHINGHYRNMLKAYQNNKKNLNKQDKDTAFFVKQKMESAKWFIDAIRQRQQTLLLVMSEIVDYQHEYFVEGEEILLKPMILKDIASRTDLDISTVSRVSNSKYIQTHFGIFSLKYFFSESMQKDTGEEVSTREIKKILEDCIENEDKRKPLTDQKLAEILKEKSYTIARRTIAKYREQLEIPVARMRKEL